MEQKTSINPMHQRSRMNAALRCGAKTRSGSPCRSPAVRDRKRCWMHGGAIGSGAPSGPRNGDYKHGLFTKEAIAEQRYLNSLLKEARASLDG